VFIAVRTTDRNLSICTGRVAAQAGSRRLPTAAARVRAQVTLYGICGGQISMEAGFLRALRFLLPVTQPSVLHS
jgi:hypothetical protein